MCKIIMMTFLVLPSQVNFNFENNIQQPYKCLALKGSTNSLHIIMVVSTIDEPIRLIHNLNKMPITVSC